MFKLKSGKEGIINLFRKNKSAFYAIIFVVVGLALVIAGSVGFGGRGKSEDDVSLTEEDRLLSLCSEIDGVGECRVMLTFSTVGEKVESVAIVCRGADNVTVRRGLTDLVTALYGIGSNRVCISKMKNS